MYSDEHRIFFKKLFKITPVKVYFDKMLLYQGGISALSRGVENR